MALQKGVPVPEANDAGEGAEGVEAPPDGEEAPGEGENAEEGKDPAE